MSATTTSALHSAKPHLHFAEDRCPLCEQSIPHEELERILAKAREHDAEITARLQEQFARQKTQDDAKAKADLERVKKEGETAFGKLQQESLAREATAREQGEVAAETALKAKLSDAETAKAAAEQAAASVKADLEKALKDSAAAIEKIRAEAAAKEASVRAEAAAAGENAAQAKIAAAEQAVTNAEIAKAAAELELKNQSSATSQQMQLLKEAHADEVNKQREALEKDKIASVNAERAKNLETKMQLEEQLQDMQRRLQKKTADEHGEGAELELFDELKAAFPDDRIRRVIKGTPGADIIHEVVENGNVCGKIVYDSKNRGNWQSAYAVKLRDDQIAEKAEHAILSTNKFPEGEKQLCMREHVVVACPARVISLAALIRGHIVLAHELRISNEAREEKAAELYAFITSERCHQLLDSVEALVNKIEEIEVAEQKAHSTVWKKRGELLKSILKANGVFCFEIQRIIGTGEVSAT